MEEVEFQKQKIVNEDHVAELVDRKDHHKPQEELPEGESAPDAVPYRDRAHAEDHQNAEDKKSPPDFPRPVEKLLVLLYDYFSGLLRSRREKSVVLNKRHSRQQHQRHSRAKHNCQKDCQKHVSTSAIITLDWSPDRLRSSNRRRGLLERSYAPGTVFRAAAGT